MKHHFIDLLDRESGYWEMVPNRDRYTYELENASGESGELKIVTIGSKDRGWERIFSLPMLQELTLHEPSKDQLSALHKLRTIKRLRITHARVNNIDFVENLGDLEEIVLEYVSGFSDLSPLGSLDSLRAFHSENLRAVTNFSGLGGLNSLRYLSIYGTVDARQSVEKFEFLRDLPNLEFLSLFQVANKTSFTALIPITRLEKLKKIKIPRNEFPVEEYALLEAALPHVKGAAWKPCMRQADSRVPYPRDEIIALLPESVVTELNLQDIFISPDGQKWINDPKTEWYEFLGKGAGRIKCSNKQSARKCAEFAERYQVMKEGAKIILDTHLTRHSRGTR